MSLLTRFWVVGFGLWVVLLCSSCGPRMDRQPSIKAYHQKAPAMPVGTVPTTGRLKTKTFEQSKLVKSPLPATAENLEHGRKYYANYCLFCHGDVGKGDGPVATVLASKVPDLTSPAISKLNDGQIYYRMLHGVGHDPVMDQTVLPDRRWQIVMYVRSLQSKKQAP